MWKPTESANSPWSDDELRQSVEVYVLLLRLQRAGGEDRFEPIAQALLGGPLARRNEAAIRYRLRNISAVAQELGVPILNGFSPAESVGTLVRPRIRAMLLEQAGMADFFQTSARTPPYDAGAALEALRVLRSHIEQLEREIAWRGHNGPPERADEAIEREQLGEVLADITVLETELEKPDPDREVVKAGTSRLLRLATTLGKWLSGRTTKFVDAVLLAAAPVVVAQVSGLLPPLITAVEALAKAAAH